MSGGGGGNSALSQTTNKLFGGTPTVPPPSNPWDNMSVNTQQGYNTLQSMKGVPWEQSGGAYNDLLNQGFNSQQIRDSASQMYGTPSNANWNAMVTNAGMNSPTGRPLPGSDQFYQPQYQPQYQNYAMTNPLGVSQYGQSFGGYGGGYYGGMGGYGMPMQSPFNPYTNSFQTPFSYMQQGQPPQQAQVSQPNYGPSQAIVSRSAGMRGTPNVVRRAEGGIASLMDSE